MATPVDLVPHLAADLPVWDAEVDDRLVCVAAIDETHDVKTFVFAAPEPRRFAYKPGQFLTFDVEIGGETVNRCYTLASSPLRPHTVSITVKRVPGGPVSNHLHDTLKPGMIVRAVGPMGEFTCAEAAPAERYLFLSGGSGITPLMAMSRAFADLGRPVDVVFLHAARTPKDIIFRTELDLIAARLPGFRVVHLPERADGEPGWAGPLGRLSADYLRLVVPDAATRQVYCCGPDPFMKAARGVLAGLGLPEAAWHQESFDFATLSAEQPAVAEAVIAAEATPATVPSYQVTFQKIGQTVTVRADQFVLATAREAGIRLPASCTAGLCGTCKSKLVSGTVEMSHKGGIRQREIDAGMILPCCSKPTSDLVIDR
ncbi:hybrid-cluster NAD(P)-dependent oxidoreductase [Mongoliimonas terrestris]|uniref:hybrid-cluster NAD(P)-dependent oxidoreductase n=1 Tax=Mongoliimonas terrestris TaxID=1709001 RepID=UPI0009496ACD|nr:hybrid-cluster NAD(P)-dependent oxidoreductase [Mongoliimonas terrestris]